MQLAIVTFDLTHSSISYEELRDWVADKAADDYANLPGVRFKAWFSDELNRLWGAVYLVDSRSALGPGRLPLLANGHTGPIGARPTSIRWLELEAFVTGPAGLGELATAGLTRRHSTRRREVVWKPPEPN